MASFVRAPVVRTVDDYTRLYGPRVGQGNLAGFLGDPSKFPRPLIIGCTYWLPVANPWGDLFAVCMRNGSKDLYDWGAFEERRGDYAKDARGVFEAYEKQNLAMAGIYDMTKNRIVVDPSAILAQPKLQRLISGSTYEDVPRNFYMSGNPGAYKDADPVRDWSAGRILTTVGTRWGQFDIEASTITRLGYLTGGHNSVSGGDTFVAPLATTLKDATEFCIALFSGNLFGIGSSIEDGVLAWMGYGYSGSHNQQAGRDVGANLSAAAESKCGPIAPDDWRDKIVKFFSNW